jgi:hypothetical protein
MLERSFRGAVLAPSDLPWESLTLSRKRVINKHFVHMVDDRVRNNTPPFRACVLSNECRVPEPLYRMELIQNELDPNGAFRGYDLHEIHARG